MFFKFLIISYLWFIFFNFLYSLRARVGAVHNVEIIKGVTGIAVIIINAWRASILVLPTVSEPILRRAIVKNPIIKAQNNRIFFGGVSFPLTTIAAA